MAPEISEDQVPCDDGRQSPAAAAIARGVVRMMSGLAHASINELPLASGLRADVATLAPDGRIWIIEIKSSVIDFKTDQKWTGYLDYCDAFYFAVQPGFPLELLPPDHGVIVADRFGGTILRDGDIRPPLAAGRRKAMTLRIARIAARRLSAALDPGLKFEIENLPD